MMHDFTFLLARGLLPAAFVADVISTDDEGLDSHKDGSEDSGRTRSVLPIPPNLPVGSERLAAYSVLLRRLDDNHSWAGHEDVFNALSVFFRELFPRDAITVWLHDESDRMLRQGMLAAPASFELPLLEVPLDFGPAGRVLQTQRPEIRLLAPGPMPPIVGCCVAPGSG